MFTFQQHEALAKLGYSELNPLQRKALSEGFLESPRTLVCAPTASGKTLLALLAIVKHFAVSDKPVFYVVPLRALASEKHREFKQSLASFDKTVGLSTGDFDSSSTELGGFDVLIMTSEKLDSLLRHDKTWLEKAGLFIFDEIHLLADGSRGATLEMVLTKVKRSEGKILGLSATVSNAPQLAQWLGAKLIQSNYRPTPLVIGLCDGKQLHMEDGGLHDVTEPAVLDLARLALKEKNGKGQALFFVATRSSTQALAKQLATVVRPRLSAEDLVQCKVLSEKVLKALPIPTHQCRLLAECVAQGVAFHNAGCDGNQRAMIEDAFKHTRCIKIIVATTTLAVGLDMPASWVVVRDLKRFSGSFSDFMSKMEVSQMLGRCVSSDTIVLTNQGPIPIGRIASDFFEKNQSGEKTVNEDIKIYSVDLKTGNLVFAKLRKIWKRKTNKLVEIETKSGKKLVVTPEHPVLVFNKNHSGKPCLGPYTNKNELYGSVIQLHKKGLGAGRIVKKLNILSKKRMVEHWLYDGARPFQNPFDWKPADMVRVGETFFDKDYLSAVASFDFEEQPLSPTSFLPREGFLKTGKYTYMAKQGHKSCEFPSNWDENICRFVAKIMSDGNIFYDRKDNSYLIRYYNKNLSVQKDYAQIIRRLFKKKIHLKWRRGSYCSGFKSTLVGEFLKNIGVPSGKKSFILRLPDPFFLLPNKLIKSFLLEYSHCDGWDSPLSHWFITSSELLARDFALLLSKIGCMGVVYKKKPNTFRRSPIWVVGVTKTQFDQIKNKNKIGQIYPDMVKRITPITRGEWVYDLTIDNHHNYIANGLVVHNSGRPKYDSRGVGILVCQPRELRAVRDKYVFGKLEDLYSQLSSEPTLRFHALALVASGYAGSFEKLFEFFHSTFYAHQYGEVEQLLSVVEKVVGQLKDMDFLRERKGQLLATPAGKRVAELYVDPLSAHGFIQSMGRKLDDLGFLMVLQKATESRPLLTVKRAEEQVLWDEWFETAAGTEDSGDDEALQRFKGAKLLQAWISEKTEDQIYEGMDVPPGVVHAKVKIQEWLAYSYSELAYLLNQSTALSIARPMRKRLQYGVKGELLPLISIRGVGRVRARRLFDKGIRSKEQAEALGEEKLKELWKEGGSAQIGPDQDEAGLQTKFGR